MTEATRPTADEIKAHVVAAAQANPELRQALLENPRAAIERWSGGAVPPQVTLKAIEEGPDEYVVVLPYQARTGAGGELSDADLEAVAGGASKAESDRIAKQIGSNILLLPASGVFTIGMAVDCEKKPEDNWGRTAFQTSMKKLGCV